MSVIYGLVELRSYRMNINLAAFVAFGIVSLHDFCPKHTCGTELCQLHKVVGRDAHIELYACVSLARLETGLGEHGHPLRAPCESVAEFLRDVGTCIVEHK